MKTIKIKTNEESIDDSINLQYGELGLDKDSLFFGDKCGNLILLPTFDFAKNKSKLSYGNLRLTLNTDQLFIGDLNNLQKELYIPASKLEPTKPAEMLPGKLIVADDTYTLYVGDEGGIPRDVSLLEASFHLFYPNDPAVGPPASLAVSDSNTALRFSTIPFYATYLVTDKINFEDMDFATAPTAYLFRPEIPGAYFFSVVYSFRNDVGDTTHGTRVTLKKFKTSTSSNISTEYEYFSQYNATISSIQNWTSGDIFQNNGRTIVYFSQAELDDDIWLKIDRAFTGSSSQDITITMFGPL